jgi:hypothetical protein
VLTGSQQFALTRNLGETLAGRIGILELPPFTLEEASRAGWATEGRAAFLRACLKGSFPELLTHRRINVDRWYQGYLQTYLERDIRGIHNIGSLREFERFLQLLAARSAQMLNYTTMASDLGVAVNTVRGWISVLESCRMIYLLPPYHANFGKRISKTPKIYFLDCGLVCWLTRLRDPAHLLHGPMAGALFENFCVQEAVKTFLSNGLMPRFFYLRTKAGMEIDFIVEGADGRPAPFEIKLAGTPRAQMGEAIARFRRDYASMSPRAGGLVSLSERSGMLTRDVRLLSIREFIGAVKALGKA